MVEVFGPRTGKAFDVVKNPLSSFAGVTLFQLSSSGAPPAKLALCVFQ